MFYRLRKIIKKQSEWNRLNNEWIRCFKEKEKQEKKFAKQKQQNKSKLIDLCCKQVTIIERVNLLKQQKNDKYSVIDEETLKQEMLGEQLEDEKWYKSHGEEGFRNQEPKGEPNMPKECKVCKLVMCSSNCYDKVYKKEEGN